MHGDHAAAELTLQYRICIYIINNPILNIQYHCIVKLYYFQALYYVIIYTDIIV